MKEADDELLLVLAVGWKGEGRDSPHRHLPRKGCVSRRDRFLLVYASVVKGRGEERVEINQT